MNRIERLTRFGLTKLEALLYAALLEEGEMTGYEAAKLTGISRSNVYTALAGLVDRGAAWLVEGAAARYTPVPLPEFCGNAIRGLEQLRDELLADPPKPKRGTEGYVTIQGREAILHKMKNMIVAASERVYTALPESEFGLVLEELARAAGRGVRVVAVTDHPGPPAGIEVHRASQPPHQVRLIVDSAEVLTGDADGEGATCLYSRKKNLIDLFKDALRNEIRLIELEKGNGK